MHRVVIHIRISMKKTQRYIEIKIILKPVKIIKRDLKNLHASL